MTNNPLKHRYPEGFLWGAATASYQIEGAHDADGRGESIWDRFSHTPGKVEGGDTGDRACDHYRRYRDDVALMKELGLRAYRFSVAWPRVMPNGDGEPNRAGLDFYRSLAAELRGAGIMPVATLYHWDLPQALQDRGGWLNRETCYAFARYARVVFEALGDGVGMWITHNEPWCAAFLGHAHGVHAPGIVDPSMKSALLAGHHLLLSHGLALREYRATGLKAPIGIALNMAPQAPLEDTPQDAEAARRAHRAGNDWFAMPVLRGEYPDDIAARYREAGIMPAIEPGDMATIGAGADFLGINVYFRQLAAHDPAAGPVEARVDFGPGPRTSMGWEAYPAATRDILAAIGAEYPGVDLYITENGAAYEDRVELDRDGQPRVRDTERIAFIEGQLRHAHEVFAAGVPFKGYFLWSLMDNFEWAFGYAKRFGIVRVDYENQARTLKESALWYRRVIEANGL